MNTGTPQSDQSECDLVIAGGLVIDGTGSAPRAADVAVRGSRVAAIITPGSARGATVLDAGGKLVCPGFIDLHSHADFTICGHPAADTALRQGVTTLVTGNCGWSPFPRVPGGSLEEACSFFEPELDWSFHDAASYAEVVSRAAPAVNLALQLGHSALRLAVLGGADRSPDRRELGRMCSMLTQAAEQGVYGFSTGLIYAPSSYAGSQEIEALAAVAAGHGLLYSTHIRNESNLLLDAVTEALETARKASVRLQISHLKAMGTANHGSVVEALRRIDSAYAEGLDVACDVYPYTASSTTLTSRLPGWAMDGGVDGLLARLAEPAIRRRIADQVDELLGRGLDPERIVVAALPPGPWETSVGRTLSEIAAKARMGVADAMLQILADHEGAVAVIIHSMSEDDMIGVLRHPRASIASDGSVLRASGRGRPHPRSFGSFSRVLGHYVRERHTLSLVEAVRKMTSLPAARIGLTDRGELRPDAIADIAIVDQKEVADHASYENPWQLATGVSHVLVAGGLAVADGEMTGLRLGQVLRR